MGFMFSEAFWGIFLILLGIAIVLKAVFGINIPLVRTGFAILLICAGISMLAGGKPEFTSSDTILFNHSEIKADTANLRDYSIIFGSGTIDFTQVKPINGMKKIDVSAVFSSATIKLNPDVPVVIKVDSAFGRAYFPDGNYVTFGEYSYHTPKMPEPGEPYLEVDADVVFGSLAIVNETVPAPAAEKNE